MAFPPHWQSYKFQGKSAVSLCYSIVETEMLLLLRTAAVPTTGYVRTCRMVPVRKGHSHVPTVNFLACRKHGPSLARCACGPYLLVYVVAAVLPLIFCLERLLQYVKLFWSRHHFLKRRWIFVEEQSTRTEDVHVCMTELSKLARADWVVPSSEA